MVGRLLQDVVIGERELPSASYFPAKMESDGLLDVYGRQCLRGSEDAYPMNCELRQLEI